MQIKINLSHNISAQASAQAVALPHSFRPNFANLGYDPSTNSASGMFTGVMGNQLLAWQFPFLLPALPSVDLEIDTDLHMRAYAQQQRILQYLVLRDMDPVVQQPPALPTTVNPTGEVLFNEWSVDSTSWDSIIPLLPIYTVLHAQPQQVAMGSMGELCCFQFIRIV